MNRIQGQVEPHSQLAMSALTWISNTIRPLQPKELREALAVEPGDHALDDEAIPEEALIVSVSAGLITIDAESETIRLVHFTVEEYFRDLKHKWFPRAHSQIAETCLTYLAFDVFESGDCSSDEEYKPQLEKNCLLDYAARNWGLHASRAENAIGDVALTFLLDKRKVACASQILLKEYLYPYRSVKKVPQQFTGLHLIAYFNVMDLAKRWLEEPEAVVNPEDMDGRTPLSWAAENGHTAVVQLLLARSDVVADSQDEDGPTPLSWAARNGHTAVVQLLLARSDVVANSQDKDGRTPLSWAAEAYHEEKVVKLLLDRDDVVADSKDTKGLTPLYHAIRYGHYEGIVKLLLDRDDVAADYQDNQGHTLLDYAIKRRHNGIVKLLKKKLGDEDKMSM